MNASISSRRHSRAFTLVELLVVIGLMGLLATVSISGYNAASNGMKNRAVMQDVTSLLRQAMQTAVIDNTKTAVLFYNRVLEQQGAATGFAIVIKQTGRVTAIKNNKIIDEFADWQQSFPTSGNKEADPGSRLFRMTDESQLKGGLEACSTLMLSYVTAEKVNDLLLTTGRRLDEWVSDHKKTVGDNQKVTLSDMQYANNYVWGREFKAGNSIGWKVGDAYGTEIASLELPDGFYFGSSKPSSTGLKPASPAAVIFRPSDTRTDGSIQLDQSIPICRGEKTRIGIVKDSMLKED